MLSNIQRAVIIRALQYRQRDGEDPAVAVKGYTRMSDKEQAEALAAVKPEKETNGKV